MTGDSTELGSVTEQSMSILLLFIDGGEHPWTVIAERSGLPVSITARVVAQLTDWHLLDRTSSGRYRAGLPIRLNSVPDGPWPGVLADLAAATRARARLGVLHTAGVAYIEKQPRTPTGRPFTGAGLLPAPRTALGQVLLAFTPGSTTAWAATPHPGAAEVTSDAELDRALALARLSGVTITRSEATDGFELAIPVRGPGRQGVVAAIEVTVPTLGDHDLQRALTALTAATHRVTSALTDATPPEIPGWGRGGDSD